MKTSKKIFAALAAIATAVAITVAVILTSCSEGPAQQYGGPVAGVETSRSAINLKVGETFKLGVEVFPADAANKSVTWTSIDPTVATVDGTGLVTAVKNGATAITVTTADGNKVDMCTVNVDWLGTPAFKTGRTWTVGDQTWSDAVIASGCRKTTFGNRLEGQTDGADCRSNSFDDYGDLFSWYAVDKYAEVLCPEGWKVPAAEDFIVLDMALNELENSSLREGDLDSRDRFMSALWNGEFGGMADQNGLWYQDINAYYWTASENNGSGIYFEFTTSGLVAPVAAIVKNIGFALRCVSTPDEPGEEPAGPTVAVERVELDETSFGIAQENSKTLTATVWPEDATNKTIFWTSDDTSVATVEGGRVTGVNIGSTKITAITADGGKTASCTVTVTQGAIHPTGITMSQTTAEMIIGTPLQLSATITPANTTDKTIVWASSNANARVNQSGLVTALAQGSVIIYAITKDRELQATCNIVVNACTVEMAAADYPGEAPQYISTKTWSAAMTVCETSKGSGWRLPTRAEAECLCRHSAWGGTEPYGVYWSSEEDPNPNYVDGGGNPTHAFTVNFPTYGSTSLVKTFSQKVRCVKPL